MFKKLKRFIKKFIPLEILKIYIKAKNKENWFKEERKTYGELNEEKIFYVIRRMPPGGGIMSNFTLVLLHLLEAKKRNLIPIIDYENYTSFYREENKINGSYNFWEYYWEQPTEVTLKEVYNSKNVILSAQFPSYPKIWNCKFFNETDYIIELHNISKEVPLNSKVMKYVDEKYIEILPKNKKILGVTFRGTDYLTKIDNIGHPIQPTKEEVWKLVQEKMKTWNVEYIFLRTEEEETLDYFKEKLGEKLLYTSMNRFKNYKQKEGVPIGMEKLNQRENDKYLTGLEYLTEIYILSKCDFLIASSTSGSVAAVILNGDKYEKKYIIDKGIY